MNALRFVYGTVVLDGLEAGEVWQGAVIFVLGIPMLFVLMPAGLLADRVDPKRMLVATQIGLCAVMAGTALAMGGGPGSLLILIVSAVLAGAVTAFGTPVRSSLVPALLKQGPMLYSGIALNAIALTLSLVFGAATAGVAVKWFDFDGAFWWLAALTAVGTSALAGLRSPGPTTSGDTTPVRDAVVEGVRFVWNNRGIRALFLLLLVSGLMMTPIMFVTLQAHIKAELGREAVDAWQLLSLMGVGIALSSMVIMRKGDMENKSVNFMRAMLGGTTCMFLMGRTTAYWQVLVLAVLMGICGGFFINMNQGLIQSNTPAAVMGRVMGLYALAAAGFTPFGALALGALSAFIGTGNAISVVSALAFAIVLWVYLFDKPIRAIN